MRTFLSDDFLLYTETARRLYFDYAQQMPVIDYHNHLPPDEIAHNRTFSNLTDIWLRGDHYKWRAMRANGVPEKLITGDADDRAKFKAWAETVPYTMRNPLYHWTHMELKDTFGITELLSGQNADKVYDACNAQLPQWTTQRLLQHFKVETLCTTDDPCDTLEHHIALRGFSIKVLPTFRPDKAIATDDPAAFRAYMEKLGTASDTHIDSYAGLLDALKKRHDYFHANGCRLSDHGLSYFVSEDFTDQALETSFQSLMSGKTLTQKEADMFRSATLHFICRWNHEKNWAQQFHIGAIRNNNSRLLGMLGADAGADSIGDWPAATAMNHFFDRLDADGKLAKTIVYNLNPAHNEVYATTAGNFQDGSLAGKMQFGAGWWFLDQKDGIEKQLNTLSNMGLLSRFVGMLTDSRSFLSYSRHDYFRRILCNLIGQDVENGELPHDIPWLGQMVQDICYNNAKAYFNC